MCVLGVVLSGKGDGLPGVTDGVKCGRLVVTNGGGLLVETSTRGGRVLGRSVSIFGGRRVGSIFGLCVVL